MSESSLYLPWVALLGMCWGSFLYVCALRIPSGISIVSPASRCPVCGKPLRSVDKIPLLSWLFLRGRCRHCQTPISAAYPLSELISGTVFLLLWSTNAVDWVWVAYITLFSLLFVGSWVDLKERWIPDRCSLGAILLGIGFSIWLPQLHGTTEIAVSVLCSLIGVMVGSGILFLIGALGKALLKREAMGLGDVKIMGGIGAFLGWEAVLFCLFFSSLIALIVHLGMRVCGQGEHAQEIPFGPYLSVAALLWMVQGSGWWAAYLTWVVGI